MPAFLSAAIPTKRRQVIALARRSGVLRPRDLEAHGIGGMYLNKLYRQGVLERPGRGLYVLAETEPSPERTLAEVGKRYPGGVICLLSALQSSPVLQSVAWAVMPDEPLSGLPKP